MIDYPVPSLAILVSAVLILGLRADRQTDRITEADQCYTHATTAGMSNHLSEPYQSS